ncbi:LPXTG cell wall anchor domain-containing protein [Eubacterium sp. AM49-13BH]|nr:LPXTG cell wall anchor domain-containing protein [Eubacterium sp. AM49-13BH]
MEYIPTDYVQPSYDRISVTKTQKSITINISVPDELINKDAVKTPAPENPTVENPAPETPSAEAPATDVPGETKIKDTDKSVKTGDKSPIAALITMLGLSGLGIFASTKKKRV